MNVRELALARMNSDRPLFLILDDDLRAELTSAREAVAELEAHRERMVRDGDVPPAEPASLADPGDHPSAVPLVDRMLEQARTVVASIEQEARDRDVILGLHFHRLAPADYQERVNGAEKKVPSSSRSGAEFVRLLGDDLLGACFTGATDGKGGPVDLTVTDLVDSVCTHGDLDVLRQHVIAINREVTSAPLVPGSSGHAATS